MTWQAAKSIAEGLATAASPSFSGEPIEVAEYLDPLTFRASGEHPEWSWEFHRDVMNALARLYSKRGFKIVRVKHGSR